MKKWPFAALDLENVERDTLILQQGEHVLKIAVKQQILQITFQSIEPEEQLIDLQPVLNRQLAEPSSMGPWQMLNNGWILEFAHGWVEVSKDPLTVTVRNSHRQVLLQQSEWEFRSQGEGLAANWRWDGSPLVGLGEKVGPLDKRGKEWVMWNTDVVPHDPGTDPLYQSIPWLLSTHWGLFLNNSYRSVWDVGKTAEETLRVSVDGGKLEQWIVLAETPSEVLQHWMMGIGTMNLPPLWALGHHQSRYSYHPQARVLEIAETMRNKQIPCDVIHFDIHYMEGYRDFTWDAKEFANPETLLAQLHELNFKVVTIVDPGVKKDIGYQVYDEGLKQGAFCTRANGEVFVGEVWPGPAVFPDFSRPEVRQWWGDQQAKLTQVGVDGIWNDMNEPSVFNVPGKTFPLDVRHGEQNGWSHAEVHNRYGSLMAQAANEGLRKYAPDKRPFVLTRAGFAGIQNYSAVWLGDNSSWWEHLSQAVSMCLNMGLSGVAFVGTDIGGFLEDSNGELIARWAQLGIFTPFCRNHSNLDTVDQEAWSFGEEIESVYRAAMELRYALMPTLYSLFEESSRTGLPIMRALLLEFPEDEIAWRISDEFLFGKDCLVAPVIQQGGRERLVYLPAGEWQHRNTGEVYPGLQHWVVAAPLDEIPMFVRAGGMLGFGEGGQFTQAEMLQIGKLEVYAHSPFKNEVSFYADAGEGYHYTEGEFCRLAIKAEYDGVQISLTAEFEGSIPPREEITLEIHWGSQITMHQWSLSEQFSYRA